MTWTYDSNPGTATAVQRRDAVRTLVGDTDTNDQQQSDEQIAFYLDQASNDVYLAAAAAAKAIAFTYARKADTTFDAVSVSYSQLSTNYDKMASKLEKQAKKFGLSGLGVPLVGGVSKGDVDSVDTDTDRVEPAFRRNQFRNPNTDDVDEV